MHAFQYECSLAKDSALADNIYYESGANIAILLATQDYRSGNTSWESQVVGNTLSLYEAGNDTSTMYTQVSVRN